MAVFLCPRLFDFEAADTEEVADAGAGASGVEVDAVNGYAAVDAGSGLSASAGVSGVPGLRVGFDEDDCEELR